MEREQPAKEKLSEAALDSSARRSKRGEERTDDGAPRYGHQLERATDFRPRRHATDLAAATSWTASTELDAPLQRGCHRKNGGDSESPNEVNGQQVLTQGVLRLVAQHRVAKRRAGTRERRVRSADAKLTAYAVNGGITWRVGCWR